MTRQSFHLPLFFALTFATTWSLWWASGLGTGNPPGPLLLLGVFAPGIVALALTAYADGRRGLSALLQRLVDWQVPWRWYAFAVLYMAGTKLTVAVLHRLLWNEWPRFGTEPVLLMLGATLMSTLIGGQAGEELGWRGYALPRMADRLGLGPASLVLGVLWALWHLPLFFFYPAGDKYGQSFPMYLLQVTAISVAMAWLYAGTRGSLLLAMLFHAAGNNTKDIVPSADLGANNPLALGHSRVGWLTVMLLWVFAVFALYRMRGVRSLQSTELQS